MSHLIKKGTIEYEVNVNDPEIGYYTCRIFSLYGPIKGIARSVDKAIKFALQKLADNMENKNAASNEDNVERTVN